MERNALSPLSSRAVSGFAGAWLAALFLCAAPVTAASSREQTKQELEKIQSQLSARKKEMERYRKQERDINRYIEFLKRQSDQAEQARQGILREKTQTEHLLRDTEIKTASLKSSLERWKRLAADDTRTYAALQLSSFPYYGSARLPQQLYLQAALYQKASLLTRLSDERERSQRQLNSWKRASRELVDRSNKLRREKERRMSDYRKKVAALNTARDRQQQIQAELDDLKASAASLMKFLKNFEKKQAAGPSRGKNGISIARHSLPWPAGGEVVSNFGREAVPALKTWIYREGVKIAARPGEQVLSVMEGDVIYAGPFRSYGNVVIIDHRRGFFTVYGLLADMSVRKGDKAAAGQPLGTAGPDNGNISGGSPAQTVYFEIRSGTTAVDPVEWLIKR
ncbi:MAG: peptidoglycan DD-metalloendopeptidase family protein [Elusimicrobiales bacterium]